jgi:hypothetical protein
MVCNAGAERLALKLSALIRHATAVAPDKELEEPCEAKNF